MAVYTLANRLGVSHARTGKWSTRRHVHMDDPAAKPDFQVVTRPGAAHWGEAPPTPTAARQFERVIHDDQRRVARQAAKDYFAYKARVRLHQRERGWDDRTFKEVPSNRECASVSSTPCTHMLPKHGAQLRSIVLCCCSHRHPANDSRTVGHGCAAVRRSCSTAWHQPSSRFSFDDGETLVGAQPWPPRPQKRR